MSIWALHTILGGYLVFIATRKPLGVKTPQRVYRWFQLWHQTCYGIGCAGYALIIACVFGADRLVGNAVIPKISLALLLGGAYFGVMGRDFAETCCERMSNTIGYVKHSEPPVNLCALCGEELRVSQVGYRNGQCPPVQQKLFVLGCKHEFHEDCIRGWSIVGKKDTCPFCSEKVHLRSVMRTQSWALQNSLLWIQMLDLIRYLVVWNPVILIGVRGILFISAKTGMIET